MAAVSGGLLGQGLHQAGLQAQQLLGVFHAQDGLGVVGGFGQGSLGGLNVQLDQLFHAFKGFLGQTKQGLEIGFLCGNNLFSGQHGDTPKDGLKNLLRAAIRGIPRLLHCNMV